MLFFLAADLCADVQSPGHTSQRRNLQSKKRPLFSSRKSETKSVSGPADKPVINSLSTADVLYGSSICFRF